MLKRVWSEFLEYFQSSLILSIWAVASLVATVAGPFGTFDGMDLLPRALFWSGPIAVSLVVSLVLAALAAVIAPDARPLVRDASLIVLFTLTFTPIVMLAQEWFSDGSAERGMGPLAVAISVMAVAVACCMIGYQVRAHGLDLSVRAPWHAANSDFGRDAEPRLLRRLEGVRLNDVVRLTVADHYVVVVLKDRTQHRLLMRFGDAVDEMAGAEGCCVHRSHWVMARAIETVEKLNGREMVVMTNGDYVPVSRTYRQNLIDAGFLQADEWTAAE